MEIICGFQACQHTLEHNAYIIPRIRAHTVPFVIRSTLFLVVWHSLAFNQIGYIFWFWINSYFYFCRYVLLILSWHLKCCVEKKSVVLLHKRFHGSKFKYDSFDRFSLQAICSPIIWILLIIIDIKIAQNKRESFLQERIEVKFEFQCQNPSNNF